MFRYGGDVIPVLLPLALFCSALDSPLNVRLNSFGYIGFTGSIGSFISIISVWHDCPPALALIYLIHLYCPSTVVRLIQLVTALPCSSPQLPYFTSTALALRCSPSLPMRTFFNLFKPNYPPFQPLIAL
eukprot:g73849.t1